MTKHDYRDFPSKYYVPAREKLADAGISHPEQWAVFSRSSGRITERTKATKNTDKRLDFHLSLCSVWPLCTLWFIGFGAMEAGVILGLGIPAVAAPIPAT